jgi:A/G-specific adenine glycosylase
MTIDIAVDMQLAPIKHAYTHFRITLHPFLATYVSGEIEHIGVADHAWVTLDQLDNYAFAVTDRKIISQLEAGSVQMRFSLE